MIVKNEKKNIERALSWGKEVVWEQVVVDTGSEDETAALAERLGAKVFHFEWCDDFSAAKNYALEQATGDWIAFLDADEYFTEEDAKKILPLLAETQKNDTIKMIAAKEMHIREDGSIIGVASQVRLFRNDPQLRYKNRIHERLVYDGDGEALKLDAQDLLMILHTGYGIQAMDPQKGMRNIRMLEKDIEENPRDVMLQMYLGDAYNMAAEREMAKKWYRRVLRKESIKSEQEHTAFLRAGLQLCSILLDEYEGEENRIEVAAVLNKLKEAGDDGHPDLVFFDGVIHMKCGRLEQGAAQFEAALDKLEQYHGADVCRMTSLLDLVYGSIGTAAFLKQDLQKAVQYSVAALRFNKHYADGLRTLLLAFRKEYNEGTEINTYWKFLCQIYDSEDLKDLLFLHKFTTEVGFDQLAEVVYDALPVEVKNEGLIH